MIDFLFNNLSIPSKTLPNVQKAERDFQQSIEKTKKLLTLENPNERRTTANAATTATWAGLDFDCWLTSDFRLLTN